MIQNLNEETAPAAHLPAAGRAAAVGGGADESLPEHLIPLPGGGWALWRSVALRGAGLPAADVLKLSEPECAAAADGLLRAEDEVRRAAAEAVVALSAEAERAESGERRGPFEKAVSRLGKGKPPQAGLDAGPAQSFLDAYDAARRALERERAGFRETFDAAMARFARPLREVVSSERFREALIWQNTHAYRNVVLKVLEKPPEGVKRDWKQRQCEELIANYLQRYCVKNDTIGFFGPVGWARLVPEGAALRVSAGADFLATRSVRFESWCVDALAEKFLDREAVIPWLKPRLAPYIYLDGEALLLPHRPPAAIMPEQAAVLSRCDGHRTAGEIAAEVLGIPGVRIDSAEAIYDFLGTMREQNVVVMTPAVPVPYRLNVEESLKELCGRIDVERVRRPLLDALGEMESARDAVSAAAADPDELDAALGNLEAAFRRLTGSDSRRSAGQMYAARTLVYEDCRRDVEAELGPEFLRALGPPLSLLLTSARWFTHEIAELYRKHFAAVYDDLVSRGGSRVVDATAFWLEAKAVVLDRDKSLAPEVVAVLQQRWAGVLGLEPGQRRAEYTSEGLRGKVAAAFRAPRAGWVGARYHSPDVMIAAPNAEAVRRGDYQLVLGEMHVAGITISNWIFVAQHPAPEELFEAINRDLPRPVVYPVVPKDQPGLTARTTLALYSPKDYFLAVSHTPSDVPPGRSLSLGGLVLEKLDRGLVVRTRDGRLEFDLIDFIGGALTSLVMSTMKFIRPARHTPRVTIDRLVVSRESWSLPATEFAFADEKDEAERFLEARRWARAHGMPRFVFVKTPAEMKPFFIDFDSPAYVNIFAKLIRRVLKVAESNPGRDDSAQVVTVSEMLPAPDQTWLPDAQGHRYTSELRIVAVDPER